jgi:hypothetical protein
MPKRNSTYERIVTTAPYKAEIYDGCVSYLEMRKDKRRARVVVQGTKWVGNTGGYYEYVTYLTMAEARKVLRRYRRAIIREAHGDWLDPTARDILGMAVGLCPYY